MKLKLSIMMVLLVLLLTAAQCVMGPFELTSLAEPGRTDLTPIISLDPAVGPIDTTVTVSGKGWQAGSTALIYLEAPGEGGTNAFASGSAVADTRGQFQTTIVIPANDRWNPPGLVRVVARSNGGQVNAQAFFSLINPQTDALPPTAQPEPGRPLVKATQDANIRGGPGVGYTVLGLLRAGQQAEVTGVSPDGGWWQIKFAGVDDGRGWLATQYVTAQNIDNIPVVQPPDLPAAVVPQTDQPMVQARTNVNVRGGPAVAYPVLGILRTGQSAEVTGISPDGGWWQIKFTGIDDGRGWLAAQFVTAHNTANVPVVRPPTAATPTVQPITDWRGEYYNNLSLSGSPALVRNDEAINFNWGEGTPAAGVPADNFSVRWTRSLHFSGGSYRFFAYVDDGVRLWVDGNLLIDQWHDFAPTTWVADISLVEGVHSLKMEYYERGGEALAQLGWERLETFADWKGEYYSNANLSGAPVLVRNDPNVLFGWGPGSPGVGVPADNFSVRWTRNLHFSAGNYRFQMLVDDGARLWIDGQLVIDQWRTGEPKSYSAEIYLTDGSHNLRLEYFDFRYDAQVQLRWERIEGFSDWKAEYFDNRRLDGRPILVRNESKIEHNWGSGSPIGVPGDNFSARWTRQIGFDEGLYRFRAKADDGIRLWLDDTLLIDNWQDGKFRLSEVEHRVSAGQHRVRVEYYERSGDAAVEVNWQKQQEAANQPPQAAPGGPYIVNEGGQVNFDGQNSRDPDGSLVKYEWDFDYDGQTFTPQASEATASHRYQDGPATFIVALRVTDNKGATHLATGQVLVQNVPPSAEAGGPYNGQVGLAITVAGTATDPGPTDQAGLTYNWDFGDGSQASGQIVSHTYAQTGTFTIILTVTDKDGGQGTDMATVDVN